MSLTDLERQNSPENLQTFLLRLYDIANGREGATISPMQFFQVGSELGLSNEAVGQIVRYFLSEEVIKQKPASQAIALTHKGIIQVESLSANANSAPQTNHSAHRDGILVLISHSGKDADLALTLIELLRAGLGLLASQIRCSSVDGYRLPAGVNTEQQLREEVTGVAVLVGLLTPNSLSSTYVLFELGARWGAKLFMIPLLAGVKPEDMRGPLSVLNALTCSTEAQLIQFVEDVGRQLKLPAQSAASYLRQVHAVKEMADVVSSTTAVQPATQEVMVYEEAVCWKRKNGKREGPYCPVCYENEHKTIHLNPGATKGTYSCGVCQNSFTID